MTRYLPARAAMPARFPLQGLTVAMLVGELGSDEARVHDQIAVLRQAGCTVTAFGLDGPRHAAWGRLMPAVLAPFLRHELYASTFCPALVAAAPHLIHAHGPAALTAAVRAAESTGARVIYDVREWPQPGPMLTAWRRWLEQRALRRVAAIVTADPAAARGAGFRLPTVLLDDDSHADRLIEVYDAVANGPRGLPVAMARRALSTSLTNNLRPAGAFAAGN